MAALVASGIVERSPAALAAFLREHETDLDKTQVLWPGDGFFFDILVVKSLQWPACCSCSAVFWALLVSGAFATYTGMCSDAALQRAVQSSPGLVSAGYRTAISLRCRHCNFFSSRMNLSQLHLPRALALASRSELVIISVGYCCFVQVGEWLGGQEDLAAATMHANLIRKRTLSATRFSRCQRKRFQSAVWRVAWRPRGFGCRHNARVHRRRAVWRHAHRRGAAPTAGALPAARCHQNICKMVEMIPLAYASTLGCGICGHVLSCQLLSAQCILRLPCTIGFCLCTGSIALDSCV